MSSCWLWTGLYYSNGYGLYSGKHKPQLAHRFIYELMRGPIPAGKQLDHICRQRGCVNPSHLRPATARENLTAPGSRALAAINARKSTCPKGHPYVAENTYVHRGKRSCMTCKINWKRARAKPPKYPLDFREAEDLTLW